MSCYVKEAPTKEVKIHTRCSGFDFFTCVVEEPLFCFLFFFPIVTLSLLAVGSFVESLLQGIKEEEKKLVKNCPVPCLSWFHQFVFMFIFFTPIVLLTQGLQDSVKVLKHF